LQQLLSIEGETAPPVNLLVYVEVGIVGDGGPTPTLIQCGSQGRIEFFNVVVKLVDGLETFL
jgi:hypothetical protein